ncbi:MAG: FAD-dependent oxidoreductase [Clostridiaceae bacterium]|nr:FAD-dependent oxidoreductase [Clostridiaceae bacterium]
MSYEHIFNPIAIRGLVLPNRIIMPAMGTLMADEESFVTPALIDYHVARAAGGCGLNMLECTAVNPQTVAKHFTAISDDKYCGQLRKLTRAVHDAGGRIGIQLWQDSLGVFRDQRVKKLAVSDITLPNGTFVPSITREEIEQVIQSFGLAARRAVSVGFDCIEIHGGHNYLLHCFLSPAMNKRNDEYGGSFENHMRLPLLVIEGVRKEMPSDMPLFYRVTSLDDHMENGLTRDHIVEFGNAIATRGVDVLDVTRGNKSFYYPKLMQEDSKGPKDNEVYTIPPIDIPQGFNVENAAYIRKQTGMLVAVVGRINNPDMAEDILRNGSADLVNVGRGQIADPEFVNKIRDGRTDEIRRCVGCDQGCGNAFSDLSKPHITCLRNPSVGNERAYALIKADTPKRVLVIGGGVAGLEASLTLAKRGHIPMLYESSSSLGGQFLLAGCAPRKSEMRDAALQMAHMVEKMGIEVHLQTTVTPGMIAQYKPDAVILAIGSEPIKLRIPNIDLPFVHNSHDVLGGKVKLTGETVIVGGGLVGLETAELLAEHGCPVTVLEMQPQVGAGLTAARSVTVEMNLRRMKINIITEAKCLEIGDGYVLAEKDGQIRKFLCKNVVNAVGVRPRSTEQYENICNKLGIQCHRIGDCVRARRALEAIAEAAEIARII